MEAVEALKAAEDRAADQLYGTPDDKTCGISKHVAMTRLERLVMWRALRILDPHQSTSLTDLEVDIRRELKRAGK